MRLLLRSPYRLALRHGIAAAVEHEAVAFEQDFASIIDVGAHSGQFAAFALARFPDAKLYCIEPLAQPQRKLARLLSHHPGTVILNAAAASSAGTRAFHVSRSNDSSSLLDVSERGTAAFPGTEQAALIEVETVRLDAALAGAELLRPTLLKIDVQGAELEVLRGTQALLPSIDALFVECSFVELYAGQALIGDVAHYLVEAGFQLTGLSSLVRDAEGRCLQADFLFTRPPQTSR